MNKKMKFVATVATLLIAAAGVITFEACNKTNKTSVEPTTVQINRKPVATYDHNQGTMTYSFDLEKINADFNRSMSKTNESRYIVESIEILDDDPTDAEVRPEIKIVVIDTEEEVFYSTWFMESFATKNVNSGNTYYYLDEDVEIGIYTFVSQDGDVFYQYSVNGNNYSKQESNPAMYSSFRPKWTFTCRAANCQVGQCEKYKEGDYWYTCTPCTGNGQCERVGIIDIIIEILSAIC